MRGARGEAQANECPGAMMPALPAVASSPTPSFSSRSVTSCPVLARKYAVVTPTTPPPSTSVFMSNAMRARRGGGVKGRGGRHKILLSRGHEAVTLRGILARGRRPMDALDFFLIRYHEFHRTFADDLMAGLSPAQVRGRPQPGVNPITWNVWHAARVEDVGVNAFIADRPQVMHSGAWLDRLKSSRRDVGTGMTDAEVDALCGAIDLDALREYWEAVSRATLEVVESLRGQSLRTSCRPTGWDGSRTSWARSAPTRAGSPSSGRRDARGRGCSRRRRCCIRTATGSRPAWRAGCGAARVREARAALRRPAGAVRLAYAT